MGHIEERVQKRTRRGELKRAILQTVAAAGFISLALMAPNAPKTIPRDLLRKIFDRSRNARDVAVSKLVRDGMLVRERRNGMNLLRISAKGQQYLNDKRRQYSLVRPKRWDHKWRVVIFDIKEPRRPIRDALRRELRAVGFEKVQDSVWAYPYPCEDFVALLKADFRIGKDVLYMVAEELEYDFQLRKTFDLPKN